MATYTVQAPDGKTVTLEGPEGASQADVIAQAQTLYQPKAVPAAQTTSAAPKGGVLKPQDAKSAWDQGSALLEQRIATLPVAAQKIARDRFFADPRIVALRESAAAPVPKARFDVRKAQESAKARSAQNVEKTGGFLTSLKGGITRGAFGIPERLAARAQSTFGDNAGLSNEEILEQVRANTDADLDQNLAGNIIGQVVSGGLIGGAAAKSLGAAAGAVASGGSKAAPVARAVQALTQMQRGQKAANAARLSLAGATGGGAQAIGEGSDATTGAVTGAIAAPALVGAGKGLGWLGNRAADMLGVRQVGSILRGITSATKEELEATIQNYRDQGVEPTLFEILPVADRNKLAKNIVGRTDATVEEAQNLIRQRAANIGPEMSNRVNEATAPRRNAIVESVARNMEEARGTGEQAGDLAVAARAAQSPLDMAGVRAGEARNIMAPVDEEHMFDRIDDIIPSHPELQPDGSVAEVPSDPAVAAMIRRKAGILGLKDVDNDSGGLNGENISRLLEELRATGRAGGPDADVARAAVNHIEDIVPGGFSDADEAMRAAYAGRSRMIEGMDEGAATRTRETAPAGNNRARQKSTNAYDSPEGTDGRFLGQTNQLRRRFTDTDPQGAARAAATLSGDQRAIRGNLGEGPANDILGTANLETEAQRAFAGLSSKRGADAAEMEAGDLAAVVFGLSPKSMIRTKVWALGRLMNLTRLPEKKASALVDMIFSQDPAKFQRGFNLLNTQGANAQRFMRDMVTASTAGQITGQVGQAITDVPDAVPQAQAAEVPAPDQELHEDQADEYGGGETDVPYGRSVIEQIFPDAHITSDHRGPENDIYDPNSGHAGFNAVDVRPIPGMTFDEFLQKIEAEGHEIVKAYDESKRPADPRKARAWGPHWHVQIG